MEARQLLRVVAEAVEGDPVSRRRPMLAGLAAFCAAMACCLALAAGIEPATGAGGFINVSHKVGDRWRDCPFVDVSRRPIKGGCVIEGRAKARLTIVTPFGPMPFADCELRFTAHVESNGETALDGVAASGDNPCPDVRACRLDTDTDGQPWLGRIESAPRGGLRLSLNGCLDTCAGWFEGPIQMGLKPHPGRWRLVADNAPLGDAGVEIDAVWELQTPGLRLDPNADS